MSLRHTLLSFLVIVAVLCAGLLGFWSGRPIPASAQSLGIPFGGPITLTFYCTCSMGIALTIGPPVGGTFVFQFGKSIPYAYGQVYRPGPWTLGTWTTGGECEFYVPPAECVSYPVMGVIDKIGTSL